MSSQDVYNATYQAFRGFNPERLISEISAKFDISFQVDQLKERIIETLTSPSVCYRPKLFIDGNRWCALYGDNIQDGVVGFGDSPEKAMNDFDANWYRNLSKQSRSI